MNLVEYATKKNFIESFLCLDWDKEIILKPNYLSSLRINFSPCDKINKFGYEIDDECIADEEKQLEYLDLNARYGYIGVYLYYNYESFIADKYDGQSIQKVSKLSRLYVDPINPKWIDFDYERYELND